MSVPKQVRHLAEPTQGDLGLLAALPLLALLPPVDLAVKAAQLDSGGCQFGCLTSAEVLGAGPTPKPAETVVVPFLAPLIPCHVYLLGRCASPPPSHQGPAFDDTVTVWPGANRPTGDW